MGFLDNINAVLTQISEEAKAEIEKNKSSKQINTNKAKPQNGKTKSFLDVIADRMDEELNKSRQTNKANETPMYPYVKESSTSTKTMIETSIKPKSDSMTTYEAEAIGSRLQRKKLSRDSDLHMPKESISKIDLRGQKSDPYEVESLKSYKVPNKSPYQVETSRPYKIVNTINDEYDYKKRQSKRAIIQGLKSKTKLREAFIYTTIFERKI